MTAPPPTPGRDALAQSLRRVQWGVLAILAACAVAIALAPAPPPQPSAAAETTPYTYAAIALAVVSILTRRRQPAPPGAVRGHVAASIVSLLAAAGVGMVGVTAANAGVPHGTAFVMVLAGAIFAARPPLGVAR